MHQFISTWPDKFQSLFAAASTAASITAPSATATEPTGDGIFTMNAAPVALNSAVVAFFGGNSADGTFTARLTGWRRIGDLWIPSPLMTLTGILGTMTGVAGKAVTNSQLFADTLETSAVYTKAYDIANPSTNQVALVKVDLFGCEKLQVQVAIGTCNNIAALAAGF